MNFKHPCNTQSAALYSIVSPKPTTSILRFPNYYGLPCRKVHGHLDRRTWNYELLCCQPLDPSGFPSAVCYYRAQRRCSHVNIFNIHLFVLAPKHRWRDSFSSSAIGAPSLIDRPNPSLSLLLIRHSGRLPPTINPLPHLLQFSPHNPYDKYRKDARRTAASITLSINPSPPDTHCMSLT